MTEPRTELLNCSEVRTQSNFLHPLHLSPSSQSHRNDSEPSPSSRSARIQCFAIFSVDPQNLKRLCPETSNPQVCNFRSMYVDSYFLPNHIFHKKTIWFPCLSVLDKLITYSDSTKAFSHSIVIFHQEIIFFFFTSREPKLS